MYPGSICTTCHSKIAAPTPGTAVAPPVISGENLNMGGTTACGSCHGAGKEGPTVFVAQMKAATGASAYGRCNACHTIASAGGSSDGDSDEGDSNEGDSNNGDSHNGDSHNRD
jgi:hypothetical protein